VFLRFHFLHEPAELLQALRGDGWQLQNEPSGAVLGTHPEVPNEAAARSRRDGLGLLTSRSLLIRFEYSRRAAWA
jgi:hypothetical protein